MRYVRKTTDLLFLFLKEILMQLWKKTTKKKRIFWNITPIL